MIHRVTYLLFLAYAILVADIAAAQPYFKESMVWPVNADDGIVEHFVYGLVVAKSHSVLAFAEGRTIRGDTTPHHIVLKRSDDMGLTWQASQIVVKSTGGACYANPTPIVDPVTGRVFLFYACNYGNQSSDLFLITSTDNGLTWSKAQKLTELFIKDKRPFHLPGPGHGISLNNGRLVMQVWHRYGLTSKVGQRSYGASVIYSDDRGKSWKTGGCIPENDSLLVNESRLVQLPDGDLLMDSRNAALNHHGKRVLSLSHDGGISWATPTAGTMPLSPPVDEGVVTLHANNKDYLLRSYPAGPGRNDLSVALSADGGRSWPLCKLINKGQSTYSDIAILPDGNVLVIYGKGNPKSVAAAKFNLQWLMQ